MRRKLSVGIAAAMAAVLLAGCGGGSDTGASAKKEADTSAKTQEQQKEDTENEENADTAPEAGKAADKGQTLLIYTNSGGDGRQEWLIEQAEAAGFNIEVLNAGGGDILNRLLVEKNNIQADLVFGMSAIDYERLKAENLIIQYEPAWAGEVDMSLGDNDGYYYPIVIQPLLYMYNPDMENPPADILDLTKPEYKDQFAVGNLGGGTPKNLYSSILMRYRDEDGEYGVSEEGWEMAKAYLQNAHIIADGEDYVGDVISGARPMSAMWGSGVIQNQNEREYKFSLVCPEIGVPYIAEQVAILNKNDKEELAKEFIDWFGGEELQSAWSTQFGTIPANEKSLEKVSEDIKEFINSVHPQEMDWGFVAENIDNWIEKAELEFLN